MTARHARGAVVRVQLPSGPCYATLARAADATGPRPVLVSICGAPVRVPRAQVTFPERR